MSRHTPACTHAALLGLFAASLTACGGGGGDPSPTPPIAASPAAAPASAPVPAPVALAGISGTVADGPLAGAVVCYDLDDNGQCDTGEPRSAPTDGEGRFSFEIDPTQAGKHRVIAVVPAGAVDKDTGSAVGTAFTLVAPASGAAGSQSVFVSPLTTLVQAQIDATGGSLEKAAAFVQSQAGLEVSPMSAFTSGTDAASRQAATVARLVLLTLNQKSASLSGVIGQADLSGGTVSIVQLQRAVVRELLGALPAVAAVASEPAIREAATPSARETALVQGAAVLAVSQIDLSADGAKLAVGLAKLPLDKSVDSAKATASLTAFRYQDAANWYYRTLLATVADNTLDANGRARYYEQRMQTVAGQSTTWGFNNSSSRAGDLHWSGSGWVDCPTGSRSEQVPPNASGLAQYSYCGSFEIGARTRSIIDVAGSTLRSVVERMRAVPGGANGVNFSDWGPTNLDLLGTTTMPAGSSLFYQTNTIQSTAATYDPRASNEAVAYSAAVAAGGDARSGASLACNSPAATTPITSLEDLIARNPGSPCVLDGTAATGARNEWWSNSTFSIGVVNDALTPPAGTGSNYSSNARIRVAFPGGSNAVKFYSCLERASNGSTRNCDLIGTGSYRIESLGDARTMEFNGLPELGLRLDYRRVFVERGGKVYYGYRTVSGRTFSSVRLNLPAANAIFAQLGVPLLNPVD